MLLGRGGPGPVDERLIDNDFASLEVIEDDTIWMAYSGFSGEGNACTSILCCWAGAYTGRSRPVGPTDGDVYRTAFAEDGEGKFRVMWSEQADSSWDVHARAFNGELLPGFLALALTPRPGVGPVMARPEAIGVRSRG